MAAIVFDQAGPDHDVEPRLGDARPDEAAHQRMRRTRRNAEHPGGDVPGDGADQRAQDDARIDDPGIDDPGPQGLRHMEAEEQEGDEVEERRPEHRVLRAQHPRRDDGGDGIGRVVQAVEEVEEQGDGDEAGQRRQREGGGVHARHTFSITMPLISLATSSNRSTTSSRCP